MNKPTVLALKLLPLALLVGRSLAVDYTATGADPTQPGNWTPSGITAVPGVSVTPNPATNDTLTYSNALGAGVATTIDIQAGTHISRTGGGGNQSLSSHLDIAGTGANGVGAIQNYSDGWMNTSSVRLTADATIHMASGGWRQDNHGTGANVFNLNGKTLTVTGGANFYWINTAITGGGTIVFQDRGGSDSNWEGGGGILPADVTLVLNNSRSSSWDGANVHMLGNVNLNNGILENRQNDGGKSYDGTVTIGTGTTGTFRVSRENGTTNNFMVVNGQITGGGKFVRDGVSGENVYLTNPTNNWTGGTDLNIGTTVLGDNNTVSTAGPVNIAVPAVLDTAGFNQTINGGTIAGSVIGGGTLNVNDAVLAATATIASGGITNVSGTDIITNLDNIGGTLNVTGDSTYLPIAAVISQTGLGEYHRVGADLNTDDGITGATFSGVTDGIPAIDSTAKPFGDNNKWVYSGELINTTGSDMVIGFGEQYDDQIRVKVDGTTVLFDTGWNTATASANGSQPGLVTLTPGAHAIEISSFDGVGGAGPNSGWDKGVGIREGLYTLTGDGAVDNSNFNKITGATLPAGLTFGTISATTGDNNDNKSLVVASGAKLTVDTTSVTGTAYTMNGVISGGGGLAKAGAGTLRLTGVSTYTGKTLVTGGTLSLATGASIGASSEINVSAGATLQSDSALTLNEVQTLSGNGTVEAPSVNIEGTISPGNSIGTLTIMGSISLAGVSVMELDNSLSPQNSDEINASGTLTYGGTLTLANIGPALVYGDTFDMFDAGTITGSFTTINYPAGTTVDNWINNLATTGSMTYVPETSTSLLSLMAGGLLLMRRRRK